MAGEAMKLSFSLSSKTSSSRSKPRQKREAKGDDGAVAVDAVHQPEYVTEFDSSRTLIYTDTDKLVIPPIPNEGRWKNMKNLIPPSAGHPADRSLGAATHFVLDTSDAAEAPSSGIGYGLTLRSSKSDKTESEEDRGSSKPIKSEGQQDRGRESEEDRDSSKPNKSEAQEVRDGGRTQWELRNLQEDLRRLPEDQGFEEFEHVPVESYAVTILNGYGWHEGKAIGRRHKVDAKIVQYDRRAGTEGIGYAPSADAPSKRRGRLPPREQVNPVEPPEKRGRLPPGEQINPVKPPERIVRVVRGPYTGSKGKVLNKLDDNTVVLKMIDGGDEIRFGTNMVADLGSAEEERCLRRLKEFDGERDQKSRERSKGEKRNMHGEIKSATGSQSREFGNRERSPVRWLTSHIRVRIISQEFRGGKFYLKKGEVVDVVSPTTCDILMDGSRELVQGVDQGILETALPRGGGYVLVLSGKHRGVYGSLVEKDAEKETGVVRDADSHAVIKVHLDQIAEFIGDPSCIGY